jgi:hypothetical protein
MNYVECGAGLIMMTVSAVLLWSYIIPKFDPGASRSVPTVIGALVVSILLWCVGAKLIILAAKLPN